jgi:hypothetical protein
MYVCNRALLVFSFAATEPTIMWSPTGGGCEYGDAALPGGYGRFPCIPGHRRLEGVQPM